MLLPLFGLAFATVISACIGAAVLALHPRWKVTADAITLFTVSSLLTAVPTSLLYTWLVADQQRQLHSSGAVAGYFSTVLLAVVTGGTLGTHLGRKLLSKANDRL